MGGLDILRVDLHAPNGLIIFSTQERIILNEYGLPTEGGTKLGLATVSEYHKLMIKKTKRQPKYERLVEQLSPKWRKGANKASEKLPKK
jgi:hypothetical protein